VVQYFVGKIGTNNKNSNTLWIGPKSKKFKNRKTAKKIHKDSKIFVNF